MSSSSQMNPEEGRRVASRSQRNSCTAMSDEVTMFENPSFCEISKSLSISLDASRTISISSFMFIGFLIIIFEEYKEYKELKEYKTIVVIVNPMNFNEFSNSASAEGASHKRAVRKGCYMMHVTVI